MVNKGDKAPDFTLKDQDQKEVKLSDFRGKKVLLAFYPFAFSPVCSDELCNFGNEIEKFRGITVLGISVDSHWSNKAFADKLDINIPLLSDFNKEVTKKYGVLRPEGFSNRAYFLIDGQGTIVFKHIMDVPGKKLDNDELLSAMEG